MSAHARSAGAVALGALLVMACVVTPPDLAAGLYRCSTSQDCVDGWTCADIGTLGPSVCRPACDPDHAELTCPGGFCTSAGACIATCAIASDGDIDVPCPEGLTCIRSNGSTGAGLCFPAEGCSVSTECAGPFRDCVNEAFGLPARLPYTTFATDRLFCVDTPQGDMNDRCPSGSFAAGGRVCVPSCDQVADRCPPIMTCLRGLGALFGATGRSACFPGVLGLPCNDDSECFVGRCLALADGRHTCTLTCGEAAAGAPALGCDALDGYPIGGLGGLDYACDATSVCAPVGTVGAPCNVDMPCHADLACSNGAGVCTHDCARDSDCVIPDVSAGAQRRQVYCAPLTDGSGLVLHFCLNQVANGSPCMVGHECISGRCLGQVCVPPLAM